MSLFFYGWILFKGMRKWKEEKGERRKEREGVATPDVSSTSNWGVKTTDVPIL